MKSSLTGNRNTEEIINHFGLIRARILGTGYFEMTLLSLSDVESFPINPFNMSLATAIEPTELTNFTQQRAYLYGRVEEINYTFTISKIIIFTKPVANSYPG